MLSITGELGRVEEFFSEVVYPIWPMWLVAALLAASAFGYLAYRAGWHEIAWRNRIVTGPLTAVLAVAVALGGYYTISPLFDRDLVCEASPIPGADAGSEECEGVAVASTMPPTAVVTDGAVETPDATTAPTEAPSAEPTFAVHVLTRGEFHGADDFHFGNGEAILIETEPGAYTVRFENFSVRNGPDLFVYLSSDPEGLSNDSINLGALKGTDGAFNYQVPAGTDVMAFKSAIVWCDQFDVLFATAPFSA